jgi:ABC-type transport system involved in multi-copper enzyme maturation permease subunit
VENSAPAITPPEKVHGFWNLFDWWTDNPVIMKELKGRMRSRRAFILLTAYLALISIFIGMVYVILADVSSFGRVDPDFRQNAGKGIFSTIVLLELLLVSFIGPGLTAGSITSEREHQTFDLLRVSLLSSRALILGKLGSAFVYLFLLILTALPIGSIAFLLGGVGLAEILIAGLMLIISAMYFCALGLFFSSLMKRTLAATVSSYGVILLSILMLGVVLFLGTFLDTASSMNIIQETVLTILLWFLISINPLLTAIFSEMILIEEQNLFYTSNTLFGNSLPYLPSPWIVYVIVYMVVTIILVYLSIRFVSKPDR